MSGKSLLAFLLILTWVTGHAQQKVEQMPLSKAIQLSLANNEQLRIANYKVRTATANLTEAKSHRLPEASVSGSYMRLNEANIRMANPGQGGEGSPKVDQVVYGMINASYPIYTGGKVKYGIESAQYLEEAARLEVHSSKDAVALNTIEAYANLYKASMAVDVIQDNLKASMHRDTTFARMEENGLMARNDLLKSQLQTANIQLALMEAESNLKVANKNMDILLGLPEDYLLIIDSSFVVYPEAGSIEDLQSALSSRTDLQALEYQQKAASVMTKITKADGLPSIAITGGYVAADIPGLISVTNAVNVGIGVNYNLASLWKENTGRARAEARELELQANKDQLTDQVRMQINKESEAFELAKKKVGLYEASIIQAAENFRITKNKYDNSLVNITDLLDADVALLQARLSQKMARVDAAIAYQRLLKTTGQLSY